MAHHHDATESLLKLHRSRPPDVVNNHQYHPRLGESKRHEHGTMMVEVRNRCRRARTSTLLGFILVRFIPRCVATAAFVEVPTSRIPAEAQRSSPHVAFRDEPRRWDECQVSIPSYRNSLTHTRLTHFPASVALAAHRISGHSPLGSRSSPIAYSRSPHQLMSQSSPAALLAAEVKHRPCLEHFAWSTCLD